MDNENESVQDTEVQEEVVLEEAEEETPENVSLSKAEFTKLKRKAIAYDSNKAKPKEVITKEYSLNDEVVDLRLDGYSKEDVKFIMNNGGRKSLEDKNSYVAIAINTRKEQAKAEAEANKVVDTSGQSEIERKYTTEQLKNMSAAELKKILPHA